MLQLEKFCYYQHLSLSGGQERPIFSCRIVDIRGTRFHVLSRIQDAGLDFTGRTNFIAHHLVFTPEEIRQLSTPPVILHNWPGWIKSWTKEPQLLENEDWAALTALAGKANVPAQTWQRVTGDAVNGYGLLEARAGASFRVDDQPDETVLELIAESLELLEVRDTRRDFRTAAWNYTFTTSMQEQDNPADFRWRCIHSDNPAANRFATPDCRALSAVRATKVTVEETAFARTGRQAPRFAAEPQDSRITEGESVHFTAKAEGIPNPNYQWFSVDRANNGQVLPGETKPELIVPNPALGISRYVVSATNSAGNAQSRVATLSVEQKLKLAQIRSDTGTRTAAKGVSYQKTEDDIERQRRRLEAEKARKIFQNRLRRNKILITILAIVLIASALVTALVLRGRKPPDITSQSIIQTNEGGNMRNNIAAEGTNPPIPTPPNSSLPAQPDPAHDSAQIQKDLELKLPWNKIHIGKDEEKSSVNLGGNTFVLSGYGEKIYGKSDSFFFVYQSVSNSVEFVARLSGRIDETTARRGIMMRGSKNADAPFVFIGLSQTNILWGQRPAADTNCRFTNLPMTQLPVSFKITRKANTFSGAFSTNGTNWTGVGTNEISMPDQNYLVGLAICSGKTNASVRAEFDKVSIMPANQ
jgi:hypothetical protein